mgnify:FL=1
MKKIIAILNLISVVVLVIGCTAPEDTNTPTDENFTVNTAAEANDAVGDIGTDLSGITDSLSEIDATLTES